MFSLVCLFFVLWYIGDYYRSWYGYLNAIKATNSFLYELGLVCNPWKSLFSSNYLNSYG